MIGHVPAMDSVGRQTNQSSDEVHVTSPQHVDDVLTHQITILGTESLSTEVQLVELAPIVNGDCPKS